jgi:acetoin utilization deacetylase AcuC-like enzyme
MPYPSGRFQRLPSEPALGQIPTGRATLKIQRVLGTCRGIEYGTLKCIGFLLGILLLGCGPIMAQEAAPRPQKMFARAPQRPTGLLFDPIYQKHLSGNTGHPERPERLVAIGDALNKARLTRSLYRIKPRRATQQELELVHTPAYIAIVRQELSDLVGLRQLSTGDTMASSNSLEVAEFAAGGVLNAVDAVMAGKVKNVFAAIRPPGHHATPNRGMGFCIFNNVAIAARYAQRAHGIQRVLIVDWDYHHGNGTQDTFYDDGSVFYFSTHHYGAYPRTGAPAETGAGNGAGKILNVPLPVGASDRQILEAFTNELVPAARQFQPEFILISAGFDPMRKDILGFFDITPEGFAAITRVVVMLAEELCQGRVVSVLEGGYRLDGLAESVLAHVRALRGE